MCSTAHRQLCLQLLYERRGAIKISMMADHGHNYMPSKNVFAGTTLLNEAGFIRPSRFASDKDCVVEINALVTCAGIHTRQPAEVAAALCRHEQIELAIYAEGPRAIIRTAARDRGGRMPRRQLRYVPLDADVLGYGPLIAQLKAEGRWTPTALRAMRSGFSARSITPGPTRRGGSGMRCTGDSSIRRRLAVAQGRVLRRLSAVREVHQDGVDARRVEPGQQRDVRDDDDRPADIERCGTRM